jgi:NTP pyrophosphatase (non-canonical NTP hydrolase)
MDELQDIAVRWHVKRFPEAGPEHVCMKATEELGELAGAVNGRVGKNAPRARGDVGEEAADVLITVMILLGRYYPEYSLMDEVAKKLAILTDPESGHRSAALA